MDVTWQSDSDRVGRTGLLLGGGPIGRATLASRVRIRSRNRRLQVAAVVEAYVALSVKPESSTDSLASAHPPRLMRSFSKSKSKDLSFPFPAGAMSLAPDFLLLFLVPVVAAAFRRPH
ncbi:hypothetical protein OPV22_012226 [Ensete ventricosum]|uniref:Uncharacterized protein n=1 Tax=Ensete ventricosum TaxID=4639 RepID=A0AAV8R2N9_ENSVE|nr:hypothetical protein OPV22_012226 [Ensete ventricosum]